MEFQSLEVRGPDADVDAAFQAASKGRTNALIVVGNRVVDRQSKRIADLATKVLTGSFCLEISKFNFRLGYRVLRSLLPGP